MNFTLNDFVQWILGIICGYGLYLAWIKYDSWKRDKRKKPEPKPLPLVHTIPTPIKIERSPEHTKMEEYYERKRKLRKYKLRTSRISRRMNRGK